MGRSILSRVESRADLIGRTTELAKGYAEKSKRIGVVKTNKLLSMGEYCKFAQTLEGFEMVEVTDSRLMEI